MIELCSVYIDNFFFNFRRDEESSRCPVPVQQQHPPDVFLSVAAEASAQSLLSRSPESANFARRGENSAEFTTRQHSDEHVPRVALHQPEIEEQLQRKGIYRVINFQQQANFLFSCIRRFKSWAGDSTGWRTGDTLLIILYILF
jgi:hypothetical protein